RACSCREAPSVGTAIAATNVSPRRRRPATIFSPASAASGKTLRSPPKPPAFASPRCAPVSSSAATAARSRRCCRRSGSDSEGQSVPAASTFRGSRSEEHTSELQSHLNLVCRLLLEKKKHLQSRAGRAVESAAHRRVELGPPRHQEDLVHYLVHARVRAE